MKLGLISDIHSNLEALEVMLKRLAAEKPERIYCLGDIVGYGANPNECVERVREVCPVTVLGNHDAACTGHTSPEYFNSYARAAIEWTERVLSDENLEYLKSLPLTHAEEHLFLVHATPKEPAAWNYITSEEEAQQHFAVLEPGTTCFIGHSHVPDQFASERTRKRIINIGSVGQPRDRDPRACCGLYDTATGTFEWLRDVYPVQEAAHKIRHAGLPEFLAVRLFIGM
jgi:diadenosine tetraphosphatase ApaH/serine/threonine PP2A family protein phosphatase